MCTNAKVITRQRTDIRYQVTNQVTNRCMLVMKIWSYFKLKNSECTRGQFSLSSSPLTLVPCRSVTALYLRSNHPFPGHLGQLLLCAVTPHQPSSLTLLLLLGFQQTMPAANLLSFRLFHLSPVGELLLSRAVEAEWNPTNHLLTLHASLVVHGEDECDVWKLEKGYLEDKRLFVGRVGLTSADGCLALWHLMAHGIQ